jgi:hypothetical protein
MPTTIPIQLYVLTLIAYGPLFLPHARRAPRQQFAEDATYMIGLRTDCFVHDIPQSQRGACHLLYHEASEGSRIAAA